MTPKKKALELYNKYYFRQPKKEEIVMNLNSKLYANIAVDELIEAFKQLSTEESGRVYIDFGHGYWEEVKKEIELL